MHVLFVSTLCLFDAGANLTFSSVQTLEQCPTSSGGGGGVAPEAIKSAITDDDDLDLDLEGVNLDENIDTTVS